MSYTSHAKKSYTISRVDNVDIVDKDIRILDSFGKPSNEGRVEYRGEGEWGTICSMGNNKLAAKRICQDIGYKNGEWKSPLDQRSKNFCKTFKSRNHCGAKNQLIHFYNVRCSELDTNFDSCNKQLIDPSICSHDFDAIIHCFNENYEVEKTIPEGTIRLNSIRKDGHITIGRLEMFSKERFLPICNLGFNKNSAKIACKQMGFDSGNLLKSSKIIKNFQLDSDSEMPFSADNVSCTGTETKLRECSMNLINISCKHDMDVVIKCMDGEGDVSGKSQYDTPVLNNPPSLGKLGLVKITLTCSDKGNNENFRGDPGSIYIVECPTNCGTEEGTIWGTGIYTSNSNVCKAAVHAGVIANNSGGKFVLTRSYGQNFYYGSKNNEIISTVYFGRWPASITFSKINSGYENLNNVVFSSFIESSSAIILSDKVNSNLQPFSFLETEANLSVPTPVFEWLPEDYTYKFSENNNILIKNHKIGSIKSFSLIIKFKMTDFKNTPSYLFSYPGCNGLNVMLDEEDNLIIGDTCNSMKRVKPGFAVPIDDKILLLVKYNAGKVYVRIFSTRNKNLIERTYTDKLFEFNNPGNIGIGRMGTSNKGFFYGTIDFIQIYDVDIPNSLFEAIISSIKSPTRLGATPSEKTIDNRPCVSPCTTNPIPRNKGSGIPPPEASLYGYRKITSFSDKNTVNLANYLKGLFSVQLFITLFQVYAKQLTIQEH